MRYPIDTLRANVSKLDKSDQEFANSLLSQSLRRQLSEKQMAWVVKLATKAHEAANPEIRATRTADVSANPGAERFSGIRTIFDNAVAEGMQKLSLRTVTKDGTKLRVSLAVDLKRIHVAEPAETVEATGLPGRYFGFINADGEFRAGRDKADDDVMQALRDLNSDPMAVAIEYGRKTGTCCVCGRGLTNAVSVEEGIGPICGGRLAI